MCRSGLDFVSRYVLDAMRVVRHGAKPRLPRRVRMLSQRMQKRARCLVGGPCCQTALGEELGFGLPQRRRGRLAVQVLRGDRAPV